MEAPYITSVAPYVDADIQACLQRFLEEDEDNILSEFNDLNPPSSTGNGLISLMDIETPTTTTTTSYNVPTTGVQTIFPLVNTGSPIPSNRLVFNQLGVRRINLKPLPKRVQFFRQGRKKELDEEKGSKLADKFNESNSVDFAFPASGNTVASDNLFLGWRIGKRMTELGFDTDTIDRTICVMGNRYCLGCIKKPKGGQNGDLVAGTMHCNKCLDNATGTLEDHIDEFLSLDFNKWARNIKAAS